MPPRMPDDSSLFDTVHTVFPKTFFGQVWFGPSGGVTVIRTVVGGPGGGLALLPPPPQPKAASMTTSNAKEELRRAMGST
jgi:hypothetical protein